MGEWQAARNIIDAAGENVRKAIRAFHGSPRQEHFDSFDPRYIGTGEGANAYSRGFYFAQREPISDEYRKNLSRRRFFDDYGEYFDYSSPAEEVMSEVSVFHPKQQKVLRLLNDEDWLGYDYPAQALKDVLSPGSYNEISPELRQAAAKLGTAYEVAIDYPEEAFLDWDASLTNQPASVVKALRQLGLPTINESGIADLGAGAGSRRFRYDGPFYGFDDPNEVLGASIYKSIAALPELSLDSSNAKQSQGYAAASELLRSAGVPGVRYLDAVSRRAGEGTRNYVVFPGSEDRIRILRKYGLAPATLGAEGLLNQPPEESMAPAAVPVRQ